MAMASETVANERMTPAPARQRPAWRAIYAGVFAGDPLGLAGVAMLAILLTVALLGPLLVTHDPILTTPGTLLPPSAEHWFGTDDFGRDVFSRTLVSLRIDFIVAGVGVTGAILIGSLIGLVCGYRGGWLDDTLMRFVDIIQSFPLILVAMVLVLAIGPSVGSIVVVTVLINIPLYARVIRGQTLAVKHLDYVDAARCSGATELGIMIRHVLPNTLNPIAIHASLNLAAAVGNVAVLSFLGIGIRPPTPDLGSMVAEGAKYMPDGWWLSLWPALAILLVVLGFNLVGDGLREAFEAEN